MTMMITKPQLYQRQSSDESYSSNTSPSKTHRRTSSSIGFMMWSEEGLGGSDRSGEIKSTNAAMDPLNMTWSHSGSVGLSQVPMMDSYSSSSSKSEHKFHGGDHEEDECVLRALELIRELSFCSPPLPHKTKKRADTAETEEISSHSSGESHHRPEEEVEDRNKHDESPIGLVNLKQLHDLRRASPSPLVGLQYLPEYSYI